MALRAGRYSNFRPRQTPDQGKRWGGHQGSRWPGYNGSGQVSSDRCQDDDGADFIRGVSTLTVMEVKQ